MKTFHYFLFLILFSFTLVSCGDTPADEVKDSVPATDSLTALNEQIRQDPNNLELYYKRALLYVDRNDFGAAVLDINRVLALEPGTVHGRFRNALFCPAMRARLA